MHFQSAFQPSSGWHFSHLQGRSLSTRHLWLAFQSSARKELIYSALLAGISVICKEGVYLLGISGWHFNRLQGRSLSTWHLWLAFQSSARKELIYSALLAGISVVCKEGAYLLGISGWHFSHLQGRSLSTLHFWLAFQSSARKELIYSASLAGISVICKEGAYLLCTSGWHFSHLQGRSLSTRHLWLAFQSSARREIIYSALPVSILSYCILRYLGTFLSIS